MAIDVVWLTFKEETICRGYWDNEMLEGIFSGEIWKPAGMPEFIHHEVPYGAEVPRLEGGAILILPARWNVNYIDRINAVIESWPWALVILCGDEEGAFPWRDLKHPNMYVWAQTPFPNKHEGIRRKFGDGYAIGAHDFLKQYRQEADIRRLNWFFSGQGVHGTRKGCMDSLVEMTNARQDGFFNTTAIFGSGLVYHEYLRYMASAKAAPAPPGNFTADSFRAFEALEAGSVPIVSDREVPGYWSYLFDETPPFPVVHDWDNLSGIVDGVTNRWPAISNKCFSWWQQQKRKMAYWLRDDIAELMKMSGGSQEENQSVEDLITVLIPTSPVPGNPDTAFIEETINSIRAYPELAKAEIIVMIDGIHPDQEHRRAPYEEFTRRLLWLANFEYSNVVPVVFEGHHHQSAMTRHCVNAMVKTPMILFVEHDTPIHNPIDWEGMSRAVLSGGANMIRLHHESYILEEHKHLMLDSVPINVEGVSLSRTIQWSQRPHLASTEFYKYLLDTYFDPQSKNFIEDVMYGIVIVHQKEYGEVGWNIFKLWIYTPEGDIKRSWHVNARGEDPKVAQEFIYPENRPRPTGAPS